MLGNILRTIWLQNFEPPQLSELDIQWLQSTAVYIGLKQIYTQGEPILCPPTKEILAFSDQFCEKGAFCDRSTLINHFREYYKCIHGTSLAPEYSNANTLAKLISKTLRTPIQQVRRNQNRLAFKRISFSKEKFQAFKTSYNHTLSVSEFSNYLDTLSDQILFWNNSESSPT